MATVPRSPLYTRIPAPDSSAALRSQPLGYGPGFFLNIPSVTGVEWLGAQIFSWWQAPVLAPNLAILAPVAALPKNQFDWPNPAAWSVDRYAGLRGYTKGLSGPQMPAQASPVKSVFVGNFDNPQQPRYPREMYGTVSGLSALTATPVAPSINSWHGLHIGLRGGHRIGGMGM